METKQIAVTVSKPNIGLATFEIEGIAPYVQNKFSAKAQEEMRAKQEKGSVAKKGMKRDPKDFQAMYENAMHISTEGWHGIPAPAFRNALISACRIVGFQMTKAKLAVFIKPDGFDKDDGTPLVKITKGDPQYHESHVRLETGVIDLRARPMWLPGWGANVTMQFDQDMFSTVDVTNLLTRVGMQVGVGEGRPDSKKSAGMGWGLFEVKGESNE